ncbi:MAG: ROK family protein, partial [Candidatus Saccharimonadales bacterium]
MYLAIDIGGTKTLVAQLDKQGEIIASYRFPTPQNYLEFLTKLKAELKRFGDTSWRGAAAGVPCPVNYLDGSISTVANLDWQDIA